MKKYLSHFLFNKQERSGIFFLILLIIGFLAIHFYQLQYPRKVTPSFVLNAAMEQELAELKNLHSKKQEPQFYPFNPNFISEAKGYALGMSPEELDRLYQFRAQHNYVNSAKEFQELTGISDSILEGMQGYFKFPTWANKETTQGVKSNPYSSGEAVGKKKVVSKLKKDLNTATAEDLRKVYGIGEKLSARIIKFRNRLGGFLVKEQLYDVYGLEAEVAERAWELFAIHKAPKIEKVHLNTATVEELSQLLYISYELAEEIVFYREDNNGITTFEELKSIKNFPSDKIDRIALYLLL